MNVLNFGDFDGASATARTPVVGKLDEIPAMGFSVVRNIGIEQELIDSALRAAENFSISHLAAKWSTNTPVQSRISATSRLYRSDCRRMPADLKEAFTMRNLIERLDEEAAWPSPRFKAVSEACSRHVSTARVRSFRPAHWRWANGRLFLKTCILVRMQLCGFCTIPAVDSVLNNCRWVRNSPTTGQLAFCSKIK